MLQNLITLAADTASQLARKISKQPNPDGGL
jgi:hypothetical protein